MAPAANAKETGSRPGDLLHGQVGDDGADRLRRAGEHRRPELLSPPEAGARPSGSRRSCPRGRSGARSRGRRTAPGPRCRRRTRSRSRSPPGGCARAARRRPAASGARRPRAARRCAVSVGERAAAETSRNSDAGRQAGRDLARSSPRRSRGGCRPTTEATRHEADGRRPTGTGAPVGPPAEEEHRNSAQPGGERGRTPGQREHGDVHRAA